MVINEKEIGCLEGINLTFCWSAWWTSQSIFFFRIRHILRAWLTSFVGCTTHSVWCSLIGEPQGVDIIHPCLFVCLSDHFTGIFPYSFATSEVGFYRVWLSYTRDQRLKVSSDRLGNEDKAPCQKGRYCRPGSRTGDLRYERQRS